MSNVISAFLDHRMTNYAVGVAVGVFIGFLIWG